MLMAEGCGASKLLYTNKDMQAIRRDTITSSGIRSFLQNPQDSINGTIRLAPVEMLGLQPSTLAVTGTPTGAFTEPRTVNLPAGFSASVYASGLGRPRDLALRDDGTLFYSEFDGSIVAIAPNGTRTTLATGLSSPHGIELHNDALYYTDERHVYRFDFSSPTSVTGTVKELNGTLPTGGTNYTRTIRWSPSDKRFYISVGSTTNNIPEDDNAHATLLRMGEAGGSADVAMRGGLRNTVAIDVNPESGELWGVDNGTEALAEELPPEEVNILKLNKHYGWPYFYSQNFRDPRYAESTDLPKGTTPPVIELQAHSEALDMVFYTGSALGPDWKNAALITFHNTPKVIRLRAGTDGSNARQADFMTGFEDADGHIWGQPVGIAVSKDGRTIYISDDRAGAIYKVVKL
jgi:glucose/arabinose dehydrogenase